MHYDCIKRLDRCPLCRISFVKVANHVQPRYCCKNLFFGSICGSMLLLFLYLMSCPLHVCYVINGNGQYVGNYTDYNYSHNN